MISFVVEHTLYLYQSGHHRARSSLLMWSDGCLARNEQWYVPRCGWADLSVSVRSMSTCTKNHFGLMVWSGTNCIKKSLSVDSDMAACKVWVHDGVSVGWMISNGAVVVVEALESRSC